MKSLSFVLLLYKNVWKDFGSEPVGFHCISIDLVGCQVIFLSGMVAMILLRTLHRAWGMVCAKVSFSKGLNSAVTAAVFACQETLQSTMTWMQMTPARTPTSQSQDLGKFGSYRSCDT